MHLLRFVFFLDKRLLEYRLEMSLQKT